METVKKEKKREPSTVSACQGDLADAPFPPFPSLCRTYPHFPLALSLFICSLFSEWGDCPPKDRESAVELACLSALG